MFKVEKSLSREELVELAKKYKVTSDFYREVCSRVEIIKISSDLFLRQITAHMKSPNKNNKQWTKIKIKQEALKYKTRTQF